MGTRSESKYEADHVKYLPNMVHVSNIQEADLSGTVLEEIEEMQQIFHRHIK